MIRNRRLTVGWLFGVLLIGAAAAHAEEAVEAQSRAAVAQAARSVVWVGSVTFTDATSEDLVERGALDSNAATGATTPGVYDATRRSLSTRTAKIHATLCASGADCATTLRGEFLASERREARRESRWPRNCPAQSARSHSVRSVLNVSQAFRNERGPAPARLSVTWDAGRKAWIVDAGLLPGGEALPVCDDLSNEVESVDPGCGEVKPAPKTTRASPSPARCVSPEMGRSFAIPAHADAAHLNGTQTFEDSDTPAAPPTGAVKYRNGNVSVEKKVVYDLKRVDGPATN